MDLYLGTSEKYGHTVSIAESVRRKHISIFGKTGCGKTTLMRNMALIDLQNAGCTVIDPHGSLIEEELLPAVPRHRTNDVIYFNPSLPDRVIGINILEGVEKRNRPLVVSSVLSIIKNLWPSSWGPRSEWVLEHALYALLESPTPVTLASLPKLLTDAKYRAEILSHVTDPAIRRFFVSYEQGNQQFREESITPVLNKVSKFVSNPLLRAVIGQPRSSFDFRRLMDEKKLLLCNLSKGAIGEDVSSLLGSLIVTKLTLPFRMAHIVKP